MKNSIPPNAFDFIIQDKVTCWSHPNRNGKDFYKHLAFSFCKDCNTFCCEQEDCGRPHLFHNMDNLESCMKRDILPVLTDFSIKNGKLSDLEKEHAKNVVEVRGFKQNLDKFIQEEKGKTYKAIENIKNLLTSVYAKYVEELQQLSDFLKTQFDVVEHKTKNQFTCGPDFLEARNTLSKLITNSNWQNNRKKDNFVLEFSKVAKDIKKQLVGFSLESKFNFEAELSKLKETVQKTYDEFVGKKVVDEVEKNIAELEKKYQQILSEKTKKIEEKSKNSVDKSLNRSSVMKKYISYRKSVRKEKIIDLDLLFREIVSQVNMFRSNSADFHKKLKEENPNYANIATFENVFNLAASKKLGKLEWDCDLAETADKYLLSYGGEFNGNLKELKAKMKEIMLEIFDYEIFDCNFVVVSPEEKDPIFHFLNNWQTYSNVLFEKYNLIGVSGIPLKNNLIAVVINLAYFQINNYN